jgi:hypothetical protein
MSSSTFSSKSEASAAAVTNDSESKNKSAIADDDDDDEDAIRIANENLPKISDCKEAFAKADTLKAGKVDVVGVKFILVTLKGTPHDISSFTYTFIHVTNMCRYLFDEMCFNSMIILFDNHSVLTCVYLLI